MSPSPPATPRCSPWRRRVCSTASSPLLGCPAPPAPCSRQPALPASRLPGSACPKQTSQRLGHPRQTSRPHTATRATGRWTYGHAGLLQHEEKLVFPSPFCWQRDLGGAGAAGSLARRCYNTTLFLATPPCSSSAPKTTWLHPGGCLRGAGSWLCCSSLWPPPSLPLQHPSNHRIPPTIARPIGILRLLPKPSGVAGSASQQGLPLRPQSLAAPSPPSPSPAGFRPLLPYLLLPSSAEPRR